MFQRKRKAGGTLCQDGRNQALNTSENYRITG